MRTEFRAGDGSSKACLDPQWCVADCSNVVFLFWLIFIW